jgi:hypothetical protein
MIVIMIIQTVLLAAICYKLFKPKKPMTGTISADELKFILGRSKRGPSNTKLEDRPAPPVIIPGYTKPDEASTTTKGGR